MPLRTGLSNAGSDLPFRVLVAPDKFKGTFTAAAVCEAVAEGVRLAHPAAAIELFPLADGGEGTLDVLLAARGGERRRLRVSGPLGEPVDAMLAILAGGEVVIEVAEACGQALLPGTARDPERTTTRGVGELVLEALAGGARRILLGLGGSVTVDGGSGMAAALGLRLLDARGEPLRDGGGDLRRLHRIEDGGLRRRLAGVSVTALCDVASPLFGDGGAARVFAPQKGATPEQVEILEHGLARLAAVAERDLGVSASLREGPGAGAAGGLGFGAAAFLGAELRPGAGYLLDAAGFDRALRGADLVVTGEGSYDAQSLAGKVVAEVLRRARAAGVAAVVVCARGTPGPGVHRGEDLPGAAARELDRAGLVEISRRVIDARGRW